MKVKNLAYKYLVFADEGHGFYKIENQLKFYATVKKFLTKHLNGLYEK